jgi:hypothetical protein
MGTKMPSAVSNGQLAGSSCRDTWLQARNDDSKHTTAQSRQNNIHTELICTHNQERTLLSTKITTSHASLKIHQAQDPLHSQLAMLQT